MGEPEIALKKEYGAKFARPWRSQLEIQPMGLGTTRDVIR